MSVPNSAAGYSFFKGDITTTDFLHLVRESDGSVLGWIDQNGYPQGTLAGTGGGGSSVFVEGSLITNPNFLPGLGVSFTVAGSNITIGSSGVASLNTLTGIVSLTSTLGSVSILQVGNTLDLEVSGSGAGVLSLNSLIGNVNITAAGAGIGIVTSGQNVEVQNTGVTQLLVTGAGLSETGSTGSITLQNTGVTSLAVGPGLTASASTGAITIDNTSQVPWIDIQNYGGIPKPEGSISTTTSVTTIAGSPNITVGNALPYFVNGAGVCIWKAGAATSQSTPSAPTVTSPPVSGSQTITYKIVGVDASCGLTAASAAGTVAAPAVFSPKAQVISAISASGGTVTATFAAPLNHTVLAGMTIHITGVTGPGLGWNGIFSIGTVISSSEVTYAVSGATGIGVTIGATGRLSNTQLITAIARNSSGVISVTTSQPHNFNVGTAAQPTIVIIEGILNWDLNGQFVIATTPTSTTFTCNTGNTYAIASGTLNPNGGLSLNFGGSLSAASATVWEYIQVACPAPSGTTTQYYIYSDNLSSGGTLNLIGKTIYGESHFIDWGPNYGGGFQAPAYVPTTPSAFTQNKLFSTTILAGGGTTSLVLAANVPSTVTGGTALYDDGPCLQNAINALPTSGGQIIVSPPYIVNSVVVPFYIINSPITMPQQVEFILASSIIVHETIYLNSYTSILGSKAAQYKTGQQFGMEAQPFLFGLASPMLQFGTGIQASGLNIDGIFIATTWASLNGHQGLSCFNGYYIQISNCSLSGSNGLNGGTNIPLLFNGNCVSVWLENINYTGEGAYGDTPAVGQSCWGPACGNIVFRASDSIAGANYPPDRVSMTGVNTAAERGILIDNQYGTQSASNSWYFEHIWNQAPVTPAIMFFGQQNSLQDIIIRDINNDSESNAILANWSGVMYNVTIENCRTTNPVTPLVTGLYINGLKTIGAITWQVGQTLNTALDLYGTANIGGISNPIKNNVITVDSRAKNIGLTGTIFAPMAPVTVTAVASGVGTIPAGTYPVNVTFVGWDGGETDPNPGNVELPVTVTVNGSQGVQISWTQPNYVQGAYVYLNQFRSTTLYSSGSVTLTAIPSASIIPIFGGTGPTVFNASGVVAPQLILPSGTNKLTLAGPTLTGNRSVTFADGPQSTSVSTSLTTTGATSYVITLQGTTTSSHYAITPTNAKAAADWASGNVYVSAKGTNSVTIATGATSGETFDIIATVI